MADEIVAQASPIGMIGPHRAIRDMISWSPASASGEAEAASFDHHRTYTSMPMTVAVRVPSGIERRGFARSPDRPTPAVMPVKAGKTMAKTRKNGSASCDPGEQVERPGFKSLEGTAGKEHHQRATEHAATTHRALTPRSAPRKTISSNQHQDDRQRDHARVEGHAGHRLNPWRQGSEGLGEGDHVEGHRDRLGQVQGDADRAADGGPERAGDDEVLAAALHLAVGGDLGDGQGRGDRHHVAEEDDQQAPEHTHVAHGVAEAQEEHRAEDGADAGEENRRGTESVTRHSLNSPG